MTRLTLWELCSSWEVKRKIRLRRKLERAWARPAVSWSETTGILAILGSVNTSASSVLRVENSDMIAPSGPA